MRLLISTSLSLPLPFPFPRIPALCRDYAGTMPTRFVCIALLDAAALNLLSPIDDGERPVWPRLLMFSFCLWQLRRITRLPIK